MKMNRIPSIIGGVPVFEKRVGIVKPLFPQLERVSKEFREVLETGNITNNSRYVRKFEEELSDYLDVRYCVAVCNGTLGLILSLQALDLSGEVIVPSFTFSATVHSLMWNNLKPVFIDIDPQTYNINYRLIRKLITPRTSAILAVHVFGNPCEVLALEKIAKEYSLKLIFDSAHGFGAEYHSEKLGKFGDVEVFSLHATKILPTGEGGAIATNNKDLWEKMSQGRNFGNPGNDNCEFWGLNAKMMEIPAILGLKGLSEIESYVERRNRLASIFKSELGDISGISFQKITDNCKSSYQNLSILLNPKQFGLNRNELSQALELENIMTKRYFYPPVHEFDVYRKSAEVSKDKLTVTQNISKNILCLPIYSQMSVQDAKKICFAIRRIHEHAEEIHQKLGCLR